jgi:hypothetical protein
MDAKDFTALEVGDRIKNEYTEIEAVVTGVFEGRVTAVKTFDITDLGSWEKMRTRRKRSEPVVQHALITNSSGQVEAVGIIRGGSESGDGALRLANDFEQRSGGLS